MNNSMIFLQALNAVDARYVAQAKPGKAKKRAVFYTAVAIAACIALLISVLPKTPGNAPGGPSIQGPVGTKPTDPTETTILVDPPEPPKPIPGTLVASKIDYADFLRGSGVGYREYWVYDLTDLKVSNIQGVTELPVYCNQWIRNGAGVPPQMTESEESALIQRIRQQLGDLGQTAEIDIDDGHNVYVNFQLAIELPEEYRYDYWCKDYEKAKNAAQYLLENYGYLLNMENPVAYIWDGSRNIYGEQTYRIDFYEGNQEAAQQLINENFKCTSFTFGRGGSLRGLCIQTEDLSQVEGTYEIISPEAAQELLHQNYFLGQQRLAENAEVSFTRLTYFTSQMSEHYIPYYECVVKAQENEIVGDNPELYRYYIYYVPAIDLDAYCALTGAEITE